MSQHNKNDANQYLLSSWFQNCCDIWISDSFKGGFIVALSPWRFESREEYIGSECAGPDVVCCFCRYQTDIKGIALSTIITRSSLNTTRPCRELITVGICKSGSLTITTDALHNSIPLGEASNGYPYNGSAFWCCLRLNDVICMWWWCFGKIERYWNRLNKRTYILKLSSPFEWKTFLLEDKKIRQASCAQCKTT